MDGATSLVTQSLAEVSTIFTTATTMITGNAVALAFIGMALARGGLGLFRGVIRIR
ncbi:MAG: hypothetical protein K6G20_00685 [Ruminococcus sp.]|nr:hypothetical protein [Ruminococcus sp.]